EGTRMKLNIPKPLAPLLGGRMIDFPLEQVEKFYHDLNITGSITAITGHQRDLVENYLQERNGQLKGEPIQFAFQRQQLGTADAVRSYLASNPDLRNCEYTLVICADTPLISSEELSLLFLQLRDGKLDGVAATFETSNPTGYGRIVRPSSGDGFHIVEEKDANDEVRQIKEVNSGLYIIKTSFLVKQLETIDSNNQAGEFYLTDLFQDSQAVKAVLFSTGEKFLGVNDMVQLETAARYLRYQKNSNLMRSGVRMIDSLSTYIDWKIDIAPATVIYPNVIIEGCSQIGAGVTINAGAVIRDSIIEDEAEIKAYSHLDSCHVGQNAAIGPFARLRPNAEIGANSKIGNFVEIKKSKLAQGVKVSHLSYLGDTEVGEESNIGCGFISCNYDGANKHLTKIGSHTFIGSDSQMVAPIQIGDRCFVASGSTITNDMPDDSFAIARSKQSTKEGVAKKFLKVKKK
ncbi:MAG: bifunctional UDP-N-acetylglucosamine diphosphorylase/glucosamine-1-phosphate N-acetyltransferase GlmU, partial [Bdellovibrionales bacterium]|nr:bifunctional UDP-N-acetylglucosamine diphosphorylase/glucosamine-1-phosphate N-acetyltransferase GlmU [Bdellovibrionales bacterium]